ncbi:YIP1 family protein [Salipiger mucosus]|uniref:Yip1 domain-containing protein n=1 Tax=Salipiger mucosus DSM 16094 TaxID=1123237 RepID=S9S4C8_9RHOB|nr:YIP1 family protein [Salipiger mucosus]EPX85030.1 hypothetical protein Salmuc_00627 [Salipiger mucosus DSM 16094]
MTPAGFLRLAMQTLVAPRDVARLLLSMNLSQEAILTAFGLVVVLNALVVGTMQAAGLGGGAMPMLAGPVMLVFLLAAALSASILFMTWAGRPLGGTARAQDVALLLVWLQALRALVQVGVALVTVISGGLAALLVIAAMLAGLWITVNFLDVAHGFDNPLKALAVLILGGIGLVFALMFLLSLTGLTPDAMVAHV